MGLCRYNGTGPFCCWTETSWDGGCE